MSGGAFDYQQYKIGEIADQIEESILRNEKGPKDDDWFFEMKPETIAAFRDAVLALRTAEVFAQRVDWFLSGDDGEENFHKRLKEDLDRLKESK